MLPNINIMLRFCLFVCLFVYSECGSANDTYRDQYCTDPRTMRKHPAYSEWADVYSCTKHRCQPGGRSLAIYTVGCKRVEAPESAIECEEVVEDTNMQFPFCCTRLRCLVVVRGEVWTRVLGQPWETLPAAPWSHMYKMKKPPPVESDTINRASLGPIYELSTEPTDKDKAARSAYRSKTVEPQDEEKDPHIQTPDIVTSSALRKIALSSAGSDKEDNKNEEKTHRKSMSKRKNTPKKFFEQIVTTEEPFSEEKVTYFPPQLRTHVQSSEPGMDVMPFDHQQNSDEKVTERPIATSTSATRNEDRSKVTESPWDQLNGWKQPDPVEELNNEPVKEKPHIVKADETEEPKSTKTNLQSLVDAIGTRMRDIQSVVEKMSEKVKDSKEVKVEKEGEDDLFRRNNVDVDNLKMKSTSISGGPPKLESRLTSRKGSRYLRPGNVATTEGGAGEENGYFSDASNTVLRKSVPKEPVLTYMAPVDNHHPKSPEREHSEEKHSKRRNHRLKKHQNARRHRKHHKEGERHKKNKMAASVEVDRTQVSVEDASAS